MKKVIHGIISITNRCNFLCKMCDIGSKNREGSGLSSNLLSEKEIDTEKWCNIISSLRIGRVDIIGVEPLLYRDLDNLIRSLKNIGCSINVTTNGFLIDKFLKTFINYVDTTTISIDGSCSKIHDNIRGVKGSFDRSVSGLSYLRNKGKSVRVSYCISDLNFKDVSRASKFFEDKNVPIVFNHYNFIHSSSCVGYHCNPSNLTYCDLKRIDVGVLYNEYKKCGKKSTFNPNLNKYSDFVSYYKTIPVSNCQSVKSCKVLNEFVRGKRYVINSDGNIIYGNRCWLGNYLANAENQEEIKQAREKVAHILEDIRQKGLYPPCQRLCCAGKTV